MSGKVVGLSKTMNNMSRGQLDVNYYTRFWGFEAKSASKNRVLRGWGGKVGLRLGQAQLLGWGGNQARILEVARKCLERLQ
jgi:hypothetical protein